MTLLEEFGAELLDRGLDEVTIHKHLGDADHFLEWLHTVHQKEVREVQVDDAQAYIEYLEMPIHQLRPNLTGAYSASTIRRKVSILRQFFNFIQKER